MMLADGSVLARQTDSVSFRRLRALLVAAAFLAALMVASGDVKAVAPSLVAGDCNGDLRMDLSDAVFLLEFLFTGTTQPDCMPRCDFDGRGALELSDCIGLLSHLVQGTTAPAALVIPVEKCDDDLDNNCDGDVDEGCNLFSVQLVWDDVRLDILGSPESLAGYRLYRVTSQGRSLLREVTGCACATLENLERGIDYRVAVAAFDRAGNESSLSSTITFRR